MNQQLKYIVTYGHHPQDKSIEVYAFNIIEAVEIANKITKAEVNLGRVTKVQQIK